MHFRYARHTSSIEHLKEFYTKILSFVLLGEFKDHEGYNGVFLGIKDENWHLEFTENGDKPKSTFDEDDALVFYPKSQKAFERIEKNIEKIGIELIFPKNPYWRNNAICFEDPDNCRIIISNERFEN